MDSETKTVIQDLRGEIRALQGTINTLSARAASLEKPTVLSKEMQTALVNAGFMREVLSFEFNTAANVTFIDVLFESGSQTRILSAIPKDYIKEFTVNPTNDVITSNNHGLNDGAQILLKSTGTLPDPLSSVIPYYVRDATTNTFKVAVGAHTNPAVNITDRGIGRHFWQYFT